MKLGVICLAVCAAVSFAQKQTEVVTRTGSYLVEEMIFTDSSRQREEHRNNVTDAQGVVTQHVVVKLFSKGLVVSYSSNEKICFVGALDKDDMPVPEEVFDDVTVTGQVTATEGTVIKESTGHAQAVDGALSDLPVDVQEACGDRRIQMLPRGGLKEGQPLRLKRTAKIGLLPPSDCGRELKSRKKCSSKTTSSCCKQCHSSIPYCFKDYYFEDIPCSPPSYGGGSHGGSYQAGSQPDYSSYGVPASPPGGHYGSYHQQADPHGGY